eukprot:gene19767-biopygen8501
MQVHAVRPAPPVNRALRWSPRARVGGWGGGGRGFSQIVRPTLEVPAKFVRPTLGVPAVGLQSGRASDMGGIRE